MVLGRGLTFSRAASCCPKAVRMLWVWPSGGTNGMLKREQHATCANSQTAS